jgi:hypothetical protein
MFLIDQLSLQILQLVIQRAEGRVPEIDLSGLGTESLVAVKEFLQGEVYFREFELSGAEDAYQRALEADSSFALAHFQLSKVYGWERDDYLSRYHLERAAHYEDRLPPREAVLVKAALSLEQGTLDGLEPLEQAVRMNPEDAEAWYQLGETYLHIPGATASLQSTEEAFEKAVRLDPRNARYLYHYLEFAWSVHDDSSMASERLALFTEAAPNHPRVSGGRLALDLAFGDPSRRASTMTGLHESDAGAIKEALGLLQHPRYSAWRASLAQQLYMRGDQQYATPHSWDLNPIP